MGVSTTTMAKSFPIIGLLFVAALALAGTPEGSAWFVAPTKNIVELAADIPDLSTLVTALKAGKLTTALSGAGPFTVFAPTNEAFAALPKATLTSLLDPKNIKQLDAILKYHVIAGAALRAEDLKASQDVKSLGGQNLHIAKSGASVTINCDAKVIKADVIATNGVVHVVDQVLKPVRNCKESLRHTIYGFWGSTSNTEVTFFPNGSDTIQIRAGRPNGEIPDHDWTVAAPFDPVFCWGMVDFRVPGKPSPPPFPLRATMAESCDESSLVAPHPPNAWALARAGIQFTKEDGSEYMYWQN